MVAFLAVATAAEVAVAAVAAMEGTVAMGAARSAAFEAACRAVSTAAAPVELEAAAAAMVVAVVDAAGWVAARAVTARVPVLSFARVHPDHNCAAAWPKIGGRRRSVALFGGSTFVD